MIHFAEIGVMDKKSEFCFVCRYVFLKNEVKDRKEAAQIAKERTLKLLKLALSEERMKDISVHVASAWEKS